MFTFSKLGKLGRFGNQLFQVASTIGLALKSNQEYIFPKWEHSTHFQHPIPQTTQVLVPDITLSQGGVNFVDFSLVMDPESLIDLFGYFQSEKFFLHCAERVRKHFEPNHSTLRQLNEKFGECLQNEPTAIVVVRRGDYARYPLHHPMQPASFYRQAMELFDSETTFFVTSDDIEWCQANIRAKKVTYLPQESYIHNFFLGTLCQDVIISNTTFGWWIAWLNKNSNKRVVAPKQWVGPAYDHLDTRNMVPDNWITIG